MSAVAIPWPCTCTVLCLTCTVNYLLHGEAHVGNKRKREYYVCIHCAGAPPNAFDSRDYLYCRIHFECHLLHISDVASEYVYANEKLLYSFMALRFYSKYW